MTCLRCNEPMPDLAPGVEQPSGICCECFGMMADEAARDMPMSEEAWYGFLKGFEQGAAAMRKLLEKGAGT